MWRSNLVTHIAIKYFLACVPNLDSREIHALKVVFQAHIFVSRISLQDYYLV